MGCTIGSTKNPTVDAPASEKPTFVTVNPTSTVPAPGVTESILTTRFGFVGGTTETLASGMPESPITRPLQGSMTA